MLAVPRCVLLSSESGSRVWTEGAQLQTSEGSYFIKGVCYHPVPVGQDKRSFENLTQDLALMQEMGVNTIRVYEPIASKSVLDEISQAGTVCNHWFWIQSKRCL